MRERGRVGTVGTVQEDTVPQRIGYGEGPDVPTLDEVQKAAHSLNDRVSRLRRRVRGVRTRLVGDIPDPDKRLPSSAGPALPGIIHGLQFTLRDTLDEVTQLEELMEDITQLVGNAEEPEEPPAY